MKLVFATHNPNKLKEIQAMMPPNFEIVSLDEIGCSEDIPETADTIEENAILKVQHVKAHYKHDCFADDTGLEVEALALNLDDHQYLFYGLCKGKIIKERRGNNGFGYDPVFQPEGSEKTFAEMNLQEKANYSHRGKAFANLLDYLKE